MYSPPVHLPCPCLHVAHWNTRVYGTNFIINRHKTRVNTLTLYWKYYPLEPERVYFQMHFSWIWFPKCIFPILKYYSQFLYFFQSFYFCLNIIQPKHWFKVLSFRTRVGILHFFERIFHEWGFPNFEILFPISVFFQSFYFCLNLIQPKHWLKVLCFRTRESITHFFERLFHKWNFPKYIFPILEFYS